MNSPTTLTKLASRKPRREQKTHVAPRRSRTPRQQARRQLRRLVKASRRANR